MATANFALSESRIALTENDLTNQQLSECGSTDYISTAPLGKKKKVPRRLIHFSDGVMEEYSTDEEDEEQSLVEAHPPVDPKTLPWHRWCWHYAAHGAGRTLAAADFCGEKLAWFFGITSPKYQYAIDEHYRLKAEEEQEKAEQEREEQILRERHAAQFSEMESAFESCYNPPAGTEAGVPRPGAMILSVSPEDVTSQGTGNVKVEDVNAGLI